MVDNIGPWNSPSFNTGWKTTFPESSSSHGPDTGRPAGLACPDSLELVQLHTQQLLERLLALVSFP